MNRKRVLFSFLCNYYFFLSHALGTLPPSREHSSNRESEGRPPMPNHLLRKEPKELPKPNVYKAPSSIQNNTNTNALPEGATSSNPRDGLNRPSLTSATANLTSSGSEGTMPVRNASRDGNTVRPFSSKEGVPNSASPTSPVKATFQTTRTMRPSAGEGSDADRPQSRTRHQPAMGMQTERRRDSFSD